MNIKTSIIQETANWVALNKPSGLLSIPDREGKEISLKMLLKEIYNDIFTVHRLDKDTSGVILFAKNEDAHRQLSMQFEERETEKIYQGIVVGSMMEKTGTIESRIAEHPARNGSMIIHRNGKEARTDFEVLEDYGIYSHVQFRIHTGRTHQIRIHMKDIGYPIACDPLYGNGEPILVSRIRTRYKPGKYTEEQPILARLALHSSLLGITAPEGERIRIEAELPKDMRATLQQLAKRKKSR
jgi:23S rRNA pseudouridine955/2504/2580 synthase/23S rRNA pseudouridine1911/1915/1917 synthase